MGGIFGSAVLDVAIGLIFVYLLLSIVCTAANEWIAGLTRSRAVVLEKSIRQLLGSQPTKRGTEDSNFLTDFYDHPLIKGMKRNNRHPTYIAARVFAKVVMDLVTPNKTGKIDFTTFEQGIQNMLDGNVKGTLLTLIEDTRKDADKNLDSVARAIEGWFEDAMDRASGWYKRRTQIWTLVVAAFITIAANADTIRMAHRLSTDPVLRAAIVEEAQSRAQKPRPSVTVEYPNMDEPTNPVVTENEGDKITDKEYALLGQLLGWQADASAEPVNFWARWLQRLLGWVLTVLAVSLGAPFWFDVLNKFMHVRSAGKSPDEAAKKPEKKKLPPEDKTA
jgi:hypothetical protein